MVGIAEQYIRFVADRRCAQLGLPPPHGERENPFGRMSESTDLTKEENFFETRVTGRDARDDIPCARPVRIRPRARAGR